VLSVGGTSLTLNTNNSYASESAWTSVGGGVSANEAKPGYQTSYGISQSGRSTPDVAYDADPNTGVYVYDSCTFQPGWYEVGGTSAGAPQWASIVALADQSRSTPLSTNNLSSGSEYNAATGSIYASNYHDITTGSNGHPAGTGYDLATGLGSPQVNNLVPWLISHN
jgi:subtilase family serine protease